MEETNKQYIYLGKMSVLKGLERSDVYLTDYVSKKQWNVSGSSLGDLDIKLIRAMSGSLPYYCNAGDELPYGNLSGSVGNSYESSSRYNTRLTYESLKALFYSGSLGDGTFEGYTDLNLQTTLTVSGARKLSSRVWKDYRDTVDLPDSQKNFEAPGIAVISIPKDLFGSRISPGSIKIGADTDSQCYVEDGYVINETGSFDNSGYPEGTWTDPKTFWVDPYFEDLHLGNIFDYEGALIYSGFTGTWSIKGDMKYPSPDKQDNIVIGDVIYTQGILMITQEYLRYIFDRWDAEDYSWQSEKPIFTEHVTCKVLDVEFNKTLNPSAPESLQFGTKEFTPYITTVGLYNTVGDLIAVAKLSKPIKKVSNVDMTFDIQIDLG